MRQFLGSFAIGLIFGLGLVISIMINPLKVLSFLDVAGDWDPSLALVMGSALFVTWVGYRFVLRRPAPVLAPSFSLPTKRDIDMRLVGGAAIFGFGWGMVGFCPGPAITALAVGEIQVLYFGIAMIMGMVITRWLLALSDRAKQPA